MCFCSVYTRYVQKVESKLCNIPFDENALCGGDNGYISLYRRVSWSFDISVEELINGDQDCSLTSDIGMTQTSSTVPIHESLTEPRNEGSTELSEKSTSSEIDIVTKTTVGRSLNDHNQSNGRTDPTSLGYGYLVVVGSAIGVLLAEMGFIIVYCIVKHRRQHREKDIVEIQMRTLQAGEIISGLTLADYLNANALDTEIIQSIKNPQSNSFAGIFDGEWMNFSAADGSFLQGMPGNDDQSGVSNSDIDVGIYNEVYDVNIGREGRHRVSQIYKNGAQNTIVVPGQNESKAEISSILRDFRETLLNIDCRKH